MAEEKKVVIEGLEGNRLSDKIRKKLGLGDDKSKNRAAAVLFCLCVFVLTGLLIYTFTGSNLDFNSDMASVNILAEEIVRTHQYFPDTWYSGQDLLVFFLHTFIVPLTLFSDDYLFMRSVAVTIFIILSLLTCVYCSRKTMKSNMWLIAVPLLFCGISPEYGAVVFGQGAYLPPLIHTLLFITLFLDCADENTMVIRSRWKYVLLLALTAFACLSGIRNIQVFGLPLMGAIVLYFFLNNYKKSVGEFFKSFRPAIFILIGIAAAIAVGHLGFRYFSSLLGNFSAGESAITFSDGDIFERIKTFVNLFIGLFGITYEIPLMSAKGIVNLIKLCGGVMLLIVFPVLQLRDYKNEKPSVQIFSLFAILHMLEIFILCIFGTVLSNSTRYLFTSEFLLLFLSSHYIYKKLIENADVIPRIATVLALCVYVIPSAYPLLTSFVGYKDGLAAQRSLTDFLYDNGLSYGYATYWNASRNTCLSNGRVEINGIEILDRVVPYYWLNSSDRYSANQGRSFLMLRDYGDPIYDENPSFLNSYSYYEFGEPEEILKFGEYTIYVYGYNIANNNFEGIYSLDKTVNEYCSEYSTDAVYLFDSSAAQFVQFDEHTLYTDSALCPNGQIIVSQTDLSEAVPYIAEHTEQVGTAGEYRIYYSADSCIDLTNGLPQGDETVSRDYLYTVGVVNQCEQEDGSFVTHTDNGIAFYGPYAPTAEGKYRFTLSYEYMESTDTDSRDIFDVCVDSGNDILGEAELDPMENEVSVTVDFSADKTFEYRLHHDSGSRIRINYIRMEKAA